MNSDRLTELKLKATGLSKEYKTGALPLVVLKNINIEIQPAIMTTIVGSSGAGKSTLLHILGALDKPTKGTVSYEGDDLYSLSDSRRAKIRNNNFGFVFQFYHLMPEFTAAENVLLPSTVARLHSRDLKKKALELLNAVGIADRAHHFPNQLSGGEQQRVAIARALMNDPEFLFADEPTGNLDEESSELVMNLLIKLQRELNFAFIMVTHNLELAQLGIVKLKIKDGIIEKN